MQSLYKSLVQRSAVKCGLIYHDITYDTAITVSEIGSNIRITTEKSIVWILEKKDRVLTAPHIMCYLPTIEHLSHLF